MTNQRLSIVAKWLRWVLPAYAVFSLTAMAGMNLSFLLVVLCWFALFAIQKNAGTNTDSDFRQYRLWAWVVFAACIFSLIIAKIFPVEYAGTIPDVTVHGFLKIWYLFIPAVLTTLVWNANEQNPSRTTDLLKTTVRAWAWMVLALTVIAIIQFYTGWPLEQPIPTNPGRYHAILFFGHHLSTSSILPFPTFVALAIALGLYVREKRVDRFLLLVGTSGILILFLSYARTAWLSLPIAIALLFVRYLNRRQFAASIIAGAAALTALSFTPMIRERIQNQMGIQDRFRLWEANIAWFKARPITGIGWLKTQEMSGPYFHSIDPEHYKEYFWGHAHSNFFEMLGGTGILGLLAFLCWSYFTLRLAYRHSRATFAAGSEWLGDLSWGLFIGLACLHINGLTNVTFWEGKVMHQQMLAVGFLLIVSKLRVQL